MTEHILFLTGKLAEKRLHGVLESMEDRDFSYEIRNIGVNVASLMTAGMVGRRIGPVNGADRVILPGLCRGNLEALSDQLGIPVVRASDDLKDLPAYFGREARPVDLSRYNVQIFAEIVDAVELGVDEILVRARGYSNDGADIIDLGCMPDTEFPHLEESIRALKEAGFKVSVDSMDPDELLRGGQAGADYLLSLKESTLWITEEVEAIPVLIPERHPQAESLYRAMDTLLAAGKPFIADSILDPIHFGFTTSVLRYAELRRRYPDCDIMMGTGNLTELTEADTSGINAILFGVISELNIKHILTTQVSPHARSVVREADIARRIYSAARDLDSLPKGIHDGLLTTHARKPFPYNAQEIRELAAEIRDPSYRVQVSEEGIHVYNRDGMVTADEPFTLFSELADLAGDAPHAFYMGVELARAQIALQLGKRYVQDEVLRWGAAIPPGADQGETREYVEAGSTPGNKDKNSKTYT